MEETNGKPITINELAVMMKNSFDSVEGKLKTLQTDMTTVKGDIEEMSLKLDNKAYQLDVEDLDKRVKVLEERGR